MSWCLLSLKSMVLVTPLMFFVWSVTCSGFFDLKCVLSALISETPVSYKSGIRERGQTVSLELPVVALFKRVVEVGS